jgi:F-box and WD-40 domain protein 1/11
MTASVRDPTCLLFTASLTRVPLGLAMTIMADLPTSAVYDIVNAMGPLLHVNFLDRLPPEVCLKILGFLDPLSVLQMALTSRGSLPLSMDWTLWQQLYYREGWRTNQIELKSFERELMNETLETRSGFRSQGGVVRKQSPSHDRVPPRKQLKLTENNNRPEFYVKDQDDDLEMADVGPRSPPEHKSIFGNPAPQLSRNLTPEGAHASEDPATARRAPRAPRESLAPQPIMRRPSNRSTKAAPTDVSSMSSLVVLDRRENKRKLNWHYLYAQRRRLEANWEAEKYVNFQLPHPDHPEEAHKECIYTIQHSGKYLVSGSRDRTLRIWNLDTKRLVMPPLQGHQGSVLCLQFDPDPSEDIIVSGSSDSTVRVWQFSTGRMLQVLEKAHPEPVLNVRFDRRILATCSKDKTIKIFNRRPMHPGELGYPGVHQGIEPAAIVLNNYGYNPSPRETLPILPPFTQIGCLEGHGAAVNAIQIYKNEIVSASGDRNVKVWDWPLQTCIRTLVGHQKGIACVQYDGRRIVSGSSDHEVKVFDKQTGLEVASLRGHTHLVRTVQAGFGDLPGSEEEDQAAAKNVDNDYFKAVDSGVIPRNLPKTRNRNAGSSRPEDIMAYGAKLPPGGGGGRYGRIVSGSYDESIIIWRRDKEGVWKAKHTFRQVDAARSALTNFERYRVPPPSLPQQTAAYFHALIDLVVPLGANGLRLAIHEHPQIIWYSRLGSAIMAEPVETRRQQLRAVVDHAMHRQTGLPSSDNHNLATRGMVPSQDPPEGSARPQSSVAQTQTMAQQQTTSIPQTSNEPSIQHTQSAPPAPVPQAQASSAPPLDTQATIQAVAQARATAQAQSQALLQAQQAQMQAAAQNAAADVAARAAPANPGANMARVFKLQFDARRIICCSQTPIIIGWDFANGDAKIEEASRFFGAVE